MGNLSEFSERLSELVEYSEINAEKLAKIIGVNNSAISHWINGTNGISLSYAIKLADFFNCSLEYLFGRTDTPLDFNIFSALPFYGQVIKIMKSKSITAYRICVDLKKSNEHFSKWKKGADPLMHTVVELADYFDCTIDFLVGRKR